MKELCVCGVLAEVLMLSAGLLHSLGAATSQHWERASFEATFDGLSVDVAMLADDPGCSPCLPKNVIHDLHFHISDDQGSFQNLTPAWLGERLIVYGGGLLGTGLDFGVNVSCFSMG